MTISHGSIFKSGYNYKYQPIFQDSVANYKIFDESFDDLSRWGTISATIGDDGVVLSGNTAVLELPFLGGEKYTLPVDELFVIETTAYVDEGQYLGFQINRGSSVLFSLIIYNNTIIVDSEDNIDGQQTASLSGFDATEGILLRFLVNPVNKAIRVFVAYNNGTGSYISINEILTEYDFKYNPDDTDLVAELKCLCGASGDATIKNIRIYKPWLMGIGESIMTGLPYYLAGVPSTAHYEGSSVLSWVERGFGDYGIGMNMGIGGHTTNELYARVPNVIIPFSPEWVIIMIGSNDIYYNDGPIETMQSNLINTVDMCIASGIKVVVCEILPRDVFSSENNILKKAWNSWLVEMASCRKLCRIAHTHETIADLLDDSKIRTPFKSDGNGHINAAAYRKISNVITECMCQFRV